MIGVIAMREHNPRYVDLEAPGDAVDLCVLILGSLRVYELNHVADENRLDVLGQFRLICLLWLDGLQLMRDYDLGAMAQPYHECVELTRHWLSVFDRRIEKLSRNN